MESVSLDQVLSAYRAAGEETRLRILILLSRGELTVSELTQVLGQSQPRVSRHLKVLSEAGLVERYREGAWVFYRLHKGARGGGASSLGALSALADSQDRIVSRDLERLRMVRRMRVEAAADYFRANAAQWDEMRKLHLPEPDIEAAMRDVAGDTEIALFVDVGTGTGRMLEVFADLYQEGIGYDLSLEMLTVARANLEKSGLEHAQVRQGDLYGLPLADGAADFAVIHQVLHYLGDPSGAVGAAARILKPGGRLMIVDFAPHELEFLRESHAHRRLGFADGEVRGWCDAVGLDFVRGETLAPAVGDAQSTEKLTVKIWLSAKPVELEPFHDKPRMTTS